MSLRGRRVLFMDSYTVADAATTPPSSDALGYGVTAASVIREGLEAFGFTVSRPHVSAVDAPADRRAHRGAWILANYQSVLAALVRDPPDLIFSFHILTAFPVELRRMALDLGVSVPIVGYTHGSHWDPTDAFRVENYPGLELLDLANLHVLDRVLVVSDYMRTTLRRSVGAFSPELADRLDAKTVVVGLPLDVDRIDRCRTDDRRSRPTVVFNHAPVTSKHPDLFIRVMARVLPDYEMNVLFTRDFVLDQPGGRALAQLAARFPEQVVLGRDMPLDDYYRALWMAEIQVSTATHESLGVSTLEAMYTGNCCILPRLGSYPEICDNHPAVLYDYGEGPLEERLRHFLEHETERHALGTELRRLAGRYRPSEVVPKIAAAIDDTLALTASHRHMTRPD